MKGSNRGIRSGSVQKAAGPVIEAMESRRLLSGTLDPSFNGNGVNVFNSGGVVAQQDLGRALVTLPDQKLLVVSRTAGTNVSVARYLASGALDTSLDGDGFQVTNVNTSPLVNFTMTEITDAVVQPLLLGGHRVIIVGKADVGTGNDRVAVVSLTPTGPGGSYVTEWGTSVSLGNFGPNVTANGVALQPTLLGPRIVVAATTGSVGTRDVAVIGLLPLGGLLDITFGDNPQTLLPDLDGIAYLSESTVPDDLFADTQAVDVAVQSNGAIVVGATTASFVASRAAAVRFTAAGVVDTSFGGDGAVVVPSSTNDIATAVAVGTNGRILVGGVSDSLNFMLASIPANGSSAPTFAQPTLGLINEIRDLAVKNDGTIVAAGYAASITPQFTLQEQHLVIEYDPATLLSPTFQGSVAAMNIGGPETAGYVADPEPVLNLTLQTVGGEQRTIIGGSLMKDDFSDQDLFVAALTMNPVIDSNGNLLISGSYGNDTIHIWGNGGGATVNGRSYFPSGDIIVTGGDGDDIVTVGGSVNVDIVMFGGAGDDKFKGGDGNDVLVGGEGQDMLLGGGGRDIIIGGKGADRILGNAEDDIIIAGYTIFDEDADALRQILSEWTSGNSFQQRVWNLQNGGGLNGSLVLDGVTTVIDDAEQDVLTGASGTDWFLFNSDSSGVLDVVTDLSKFEAMFDVDLSVLNIG